ncbi:MAG: hypothetical protein RLZZ528_539 [Pseudomonadota bacterium]
MLNDIVALLRLTLRDTRAAFRALLDVAPTAEARWLGFGIVVLLSVVLTQLALLGVPDEALPPFMAAMRGPVSGVVTQGVTVLALAFGASVVARLFGGTARFIDALWLVVWIEFVLVVIEVAVLVVALVLPPLADMLGLAGIVIFFLLLTRAVMFLNGFRQAALVLVGIIAFMIVGGVVLVFVLSALGFVALPPLPSGAATLGMN